MLITETLHGSTERDSLRIVGSQPNPDRTGDSDRMTDNRKRHSLTRALIRGRRGVRTTQWDQCHLGYTSVLLSTTAAAWPATLCQPNWKDLTLSTTCSCPFTNTAFDQCFPKRCGWLHMADTGRGQGVFEVLVKFNRFHKSHWGHRQMCQKAWTKSYGIIF